MDKEASPSVTIRRATKEDAEAFVDLAIEAGGDLFPTLFGAQARKVLKALFERSGNHMSHDKAYFVTVDGRIAGLMHGYDWRQQRAEHAYTDWLYFRQLTWRVVRVLPILFCLPRWFGSAARGEYYVTSLAVYPEFRGRGLSRLLLYHADEMARAAGCTIVSLDAEPTNEPAFTLYRKTGYIVEKEVHARLFGRPWIRLCRMRKPL